MGLHTLYHDCGACVIDGQRVVSISEERLNRQKHWGGFPTLSVRYCLDAFGLSGFNEIDLVAVDHMKDRQRDIEATIRAAGYDGTIEFVDHHDAHAAGAYFCSPFDEAAVLVVDGEGSLAPERRGLFHSYRPREVQSFYRADGEGLALLRRTYTRRTHRNGIGHFYGGVSRFLNLGPFGAGKVMGLAPYGRGNEELLFEFDGGDVLYRDALDLRGTRDLGRFGKRYAGGLAPRTDEALPDTAYADLAWRAQHNTERAMVAVAQWLYGQTRVNRLCLSGGVALNSVANQRVLDETPFEELFVQPACSDAGIPFGAAMHAWHVTLGRPRFFRMDDAFQGRLYTDEEVREALESRSGLAWERPEDPAARAADLLAGGAIIGWFEGRSETGPRALGHRSLLADPRSVTLRERMNREVKRREPWRPFAPSVLSERAREYFELVCASPFMLLVARVVAARRAEVPAIVHVDGTARVQTVDRGGGRFRRLIEAFDRRTGVPMVLNTSFNLAGNPIVETPGDALDCFLGSTTDALVLDSYLVRKR